MLFQNVSRETFTPNIRYNFLMFHVKHFDRKKDWKTSPLSLLVYCCEW